MNPEIKAKWVAALRSGEYKQGESYLQIEDRFCCLGVLCDLYSKEFGERWKSVKGEEHKTFQKEENLLPQKVKSWAGLIFVGGDDVTIRGERNRLWWHNDKGRSFAEIADAIEAQL